MLGFGEGGQGLKEGGRAGDEQPPTAAVTEERRREHGIGDSARPAGLRG